MKTRVVAWFSGGVSSAYACWLSLQIYKNVMIVFIDTKNEDLDTYRFLLDCEQLYGQPIERITRIGKDYQKISDVWDKYLSLNTAHGAICSTELKREVRESFQNLVIDHAQIFGFDAEEKKRHFNMRRNYPEINVVSLLFENRIGKKQALQFFKDRGIEIPLAYRLGFRNNNCLMSGCVRGGIGYWQKYKKVFPDRFDAMANREHDYTNRKGEPVTILKDRKGGKVARLFLKPHPDYPEIRDISMMKGRRVESLIECTGFCGTLF